MRKAAILMLVAAVAMSIAAPSADAKKKKKKKKKRVERTAEGDYLTPALGGVSGVGTTCQAEPVGCVSFAVESNEAYVTLDIADASGQPAYASVYAFGYFDGSESHDHICGSSDYPIPLAPGLSELVIVVGESNAPLAGCTGPATTGTVTATFSNLP